jgi:membrane protein insertase Oxa1/YidC/SpoIIIJ
VLFILPKTLTGVAVLGAGASILIGWAWNIYDPQAFLSFVRQFPDEYMNLLASWWSAAIAWLR